MLLTKDDKLDKVSLQLFFSGPKGSLLCGGSNQESQFIIWEMAPLVATGPLQPQGPAVGSDQTFISCIGRGFFSTVTWDSYLYPMLFYPCHMEAGSPSQELSFLLVGAF